jgi:hypothetical protein
MFQEQPLYWEDVEKIQTFLMKATSETMKNMEENCDPKEALNILLSLGKTSEKQKGDKIIPSLFNHPYFFRFFEVL